LTTGVGTGAFTTTGCACAINALFQLEEVGAAFGFVNGFVQCKIRAICVVDLDSDDRDVVIQNDHIRNEATQLERYNTTNIFLYVLWTIAFFSYYNN
jgi:hypothetical protein